jgi:hypothetical protein
VSIYVCLYSFTSQMAIQVTSPMIIGLSQDIRVVFHRWFALLTLLFIVTDRVLNESRARERDERRERGMYVPSTHIFFALLPHAFIY